MVEAAAAVVGGGGARAGVKDPGRLAEAIAVAERVLLDALS